MDSEIKINPESCQCWYTHNTCHQIVLENRPGTKSTFTLGILSEAQESKRPQPWDISILGLPRHPLFGERVKSLKVTYLALTFATISEKDGFVHAFDTISKLRNKDDRDYHEANARFKRRANKPNANERLRRSSTAVLPLSRSSTAPTLGSVSFGKDLEDCILSEKIFSAASLT